MADFVVSEDVAKQLSTRYAIDKKTILEIQRLWNMIDRELGAAVTKIGIRAANDHELQGAIASISMVSDTVDKAMRMLPDPLDHNTKPLP